MIRVSILYPNVPGKRFDHDYYQNVHIPMAIRLLGPAIRSVTVERGIAPGPHWPNPAFFAIASFVCNSVAAYTRALVPHMKRLQEDVTNYTDVEAIVQIGEIVVEQCAPAADGS
jgi:uncharacterized protein (TIGR02118 family)